jgi:hypothetical protein
MSYTLTINDGLGVIVLRAKQPMTFEEIRMVFVEMVSLPDFKEGMCLVADFRGSNTTLSADHVRRLTVHALHTDSAWGNTKWAFLASDSLMYGLSRMFGTLTDEHQVTTHVFRTVMEADGWLGIGIEMDEILARTPERLEDIRLAQAEAMEDTNTRTAQRSPL